MPCSDLKGANVLLKSVKATQNDHRGYVCKLADFGLARVLGANRTHVSTNTYGDQLPCLCLCVFLSLRVSVSVCVPTSVSCA
jgi:serine/threonine protein kinase